MGIKIVFLLLANIVDAFSGDIIGCVEPPSARSSVSQVYLKILQLHSGSLSHNGNLSPNSGALGSAQRVGFFNIGSGRVGYWTKYRVAGRVRVG